MNLVIFSLGALKPSLRHNELTFQNLVLLQRNLILSVFLLEFLIQHPLFLTKAVNLHR